MRSHTPPTATVPGQENIAGPVRQAIPRPDDRERHEREQDREHCPACGHRLAKRVYRGPGADA